MDNLPEIPQSLRELMAEIGPKWSAATHMNLMGDKFSEVLAGAPKRARVTRDVAYSTHPRQVLDAYEPLERPLGPAVLFVHGGAFTEGEKDRTPEVFANVGYYLARHGVTCFNVEYRLAPEFTYPSGTEDMAAAVACGSAVNGVRPPPVGTLAGSIPYS